VHGGVGDVLDLQGGERAGRGRRRQGGRVGGRGRGGTLRALPPASRESCGRLWPAARRGGGRQGCGGVQRACAAGGRRRPSPAAPARECRTPTRGWSCRPRWTRTACGPRHAGPGGAERGGLAKVGASAVGSAGPRQEARHADCAACAHALFIRPAAEPPHRALRPPPAPVPRPPAPCPLPYSGPRLILRGVPAPPCRPSSRTGPRR
jgi:hypothetical protein